MNFDFERIHKHLRPKALKQAQLDKILRVFLF